MRPFVSPSDAKNADP